MTKVRLTDYVTQPLHAHGVRHIFMLTGGGAMHLNDAMGRVEDRRMVTAPLEDFAPFLPREELEANMIIPLMS